MALKKHDFIEIEYTGKTKEGDIFDSNIRKDMEKLHEGHSHPIEAKPFIFCIGEGMFLKAIDDFLVGKPEKSEDYTVELPPEMAFGQRSSALVQMVPLKAFIQNETRPVPGMVFNMDGRLAKVITVSSGRVVLDFNSPLAGKDVVYHIRVLRKVEDINEQLKSFIDFLFRRDLKFELEGKKLVIFAEKPIMDFVRMFEGKFKDIFNLELEVREAREK